MKTEFERWWNKNINRMPDAGNNLQRLHDLFQAAWHHGMTFGYDEGYADAVEFEHASYLEIEPDSYQGQTEYEQREANNRKE